MIPIEVAIDFPSLQANKGLYFIGQTPILEGQTGTALALLHNPCDSGRLIYVNAITITNISDKNLSAEFYLRLKLHDGNVSNMVTSTNTAICPSVLPVGMIQYYTPPVPHPGKGIAIFSRIVPPRSTLVVDGGQIILGEKQSLGVYIGGFERVSFDSIRFAFGWSEKEQSYCK